ncbi:MAG: hypothetical protein K2P25_14275, partial [Lachnospiraceae bacterium]|nr:hypothetical protein [Lachnospiraceae bacterium]
MKTLINTGFALGSTWQHPQLPILKPINIVKALKTAACASSKGFLRGRIYPPGQIILYGRIYPQGRISIIYLSYLWLSTMSKEGVPLTLVLLPGKSDFI